MFVKQITRNTESQLQVDSCVSFVVGPIRNAPKTFE